MPGPWRDEELSADEQISTYHRKLSLHESQRLLDRRLKREEAVNKMREQKRGKKINRLKSDREAFAEYKKLEEVDKRIKEKEGAYMQRMRKEKHLPPLPKMQEGRYPFSLSFPPLPLPPFLLFVSLLLPIRYETIIAEFDRKRAERRGTKFPSQDQLAKWKQVTKKKQQQEKGRKFQTQE